MDISNPLITIIAIEVVMAIVVSKVRVATLSTMPIVIIFRLNGSVSIRAVIVIANDNIT